MDERALPADAADQSLPLEVSERLADGAAGDIQLLRELWLGRQCIPRLEPPRLYVPD
jgi:hypothetical protein